MLGSYFQFKDTYIFSRQDMCYTSIGHAEKKVLYTYIDNPTPGSIGLYIALGIWPTVFSLS